MDKPTLDPTTAVTSAVTNIVSVNATSSFSVSSVDVPVSDVAMETGMQFNPSMSLGMPTSATSKMMFGQPMQVDGEVLGVILDVSGSMAEFLPAVVREVDKNFKDSPIVYVRNMLLSRDNREGEARLIVPEEVVPYHPEYKTPTPSGSSGTTCPARRRSATSTASSRPSRPAEPVPHDRPWLGRQQPHRRDRLPHGGEDRRALHLLRLRGLRRRGHRRRDRAEARPRKIRTYIQPAEKSTEFLDTMTKKIANKTLGRQMPSLVSLLRGTEETEVTSLMKDNKAADLAALAGMNIKLATPRKEISAEPFYAFKPNKDWTEIHRLPSPSMTPSSMVRKPGSRSS